MKSYTNTAAKVALNPWFIVLASICSIGGFFWFIYDKVKEQPAVFSSILFVLSLLLLLAGIFYSLRIRLENAVLRKSAYTFNEINHIYRDSLKNMFGGQSLVEKPADLLAEEERVLRSVCQRIENIFSQLIGKECLVTIKLLLKESNGRCFAHTYVRSLEACIRDNPGRKKYEVGTRANIAFDFALQKQTDGPSHYFSPDLTKEKNYTNERQHFESLYKSVIVVPIRGVNRGKEGTDEEYDTIGFLCIDTLSTFRLNDGYHVQMIASLAGQMYNFMSLMRGKYTSFVE